ncbi:hypothetical protein DAPPUDRAFT_242690 [Daphnia pulex]|uniref:Uncharacterized protein n=1 Tax=Daphnia pulex TaxID=6669 RepID=E9GH92_DAPPU|nr:hypothetical protein DAPPUDRAFT_242690 [Daphnia pulex]|eukprot:EFX81225.1 hypothetical protein DAPPUDRAFT_242690 [Daphnia pulex]
MFLQLFRYYDPCWNEDKVDDELQKNNEDNVSEGRDVSPKAIENSRRPHLSNRNGTIDTVEETPDSELRPMASSVANDGSRKENSCAPFHLQRRSLVITSKSLYNFNTFTLSTTPKKKRTNGRASPVASEGSLKENSVEASFTPLTTPRKKRTYSRASSVGSDSNRKENPVQASFTLSTTPRKKRTYSMGQQNSMEDELKTLSKIPKSPAKKQKTMFLKWVLGVDQSNTYITTGNKKKVEEEDLLVIPDEVNNAVVEKAVLKELPLFMQLFTADAWVAVNQLSKIKYFENIDAKKSAKEKDELVYPCILCKKTIKGNSSCVACDSFQQWTMQMPEEQEKSS